MCHILIHHEWITSHAHHTSHLTRLTHSFTSIVLLLQALLRRRQRCKKRWDVSSQFLANKLRYCDDQWPLGPALDLSSTSTCITFFDIRFDTKSSDLYYECHVLYFLDTAATTFFLLLVFVWLLFEGGLFFFWKACDTNYSWIKELKCLVWGVRATQWRLLDAVSGTCSLSVLLSAMETSRTTLTALVLAQWPSSEITHIGVHVPHIPAAATIREVRLFRSELPIVWLLFEGSVYSKKYGITIWGADTNTEIQHDHKCYDHR